MDQDGDVLSVGIPNGGVLVEGREDGVLDGLWDGNFEGLSVGLDGIPDGGVLVEGRADGILDGLWDGDFEGLSVDLDEDGFDVEGVADVGLDDEGLFV